jgi:hypothetical protein
MRTIGILSLSVLLVWYLISKLEPTSGVVLNDLNGIEDANRMIAIKRSLWAIMIILQALLSYKLYKLIPVLTGVYKTGAKLYLGAIVLLLLLSLLIFIMGLRAFWF